MKGTISATVTLTLPKVMSIIITDDTLSDDDFCLGSMIK